MIYLIILYFVVESHALHSQPETWHDSSLQSGGIIRMDSNGKVTILYIQQCIPNTKIQKQKVLNCEWPVLNFKIIRANAQLTKESRLQHHCGYHRLLMHSHSARFRRYDCCHRPTWFQPPSPLSDRQQQQQVYWNIPTDNNSEHKIYFGCIIVGMLHLCILTETIFLEKNSLTETILTHLGRYVTNNCAVQCTDVQNIISISHNMRQHAMHENDILRPKATCLMSGTDH